MGRAIWEGVSFQNDGFTYAFVAGFSRMHDDGPTKDDVRTFCYVIVKQDGRQPVALTCRPETVTYRF